MIQEMQNFEDSQAKDRQSHPEADNGPTRAQAEPNAGEMKDLKDDIADLEEELADTQLRAISAGSERNAAMQVSLPLFIHFLPGVSLRSAA
jgi:hypothetical protein